MFRPRKFIMTLFTNNESKQGNSSQQRLWDEEISGYRRIALQFVRLAVSTWHLIIQRNHPTFNVYSTTLWSMHSLLRTAAYESVTKSALRRMRTATEVLINTIFIVLVRSDVKLLVIV